jgi:hypothetical protein
MFTLCLVLVSTANGQLHQKYEGWCNALEAASSSDLVQFLNGVVADDENARCVTWAIHKLGQERYELAITPLVKFLDFRRPQSEGERIFHGLSQDVFPAEVALDLIGKKALPEVLRAIYGDTSSETTRQNALSVWMEIYRQDNEHPKGIAELKQEETKATDDAVKQRLKLAVRKAVKLCNPGELIKCRQAAETGTQ